MPSGWTLRLAAALSIGLISVTAPALHAAEHITLANGFDLTCDHHALVDGRVRIYTQAASSDYFELSADSIHAVEIVPDPVVPDSVVTDSVVTDSVVPDSVVTDSVLPDSVPEKALARVAVHAGRAAAGPEKLMGLGKLAGPEKLTETDLHELLSRAGSEHNVDADLLASLVKAESNGNARAVSRTGARGLMQLMPGTARELGVSDSFAPEQNVRGGTAYFDGLLARYHDNIALALAAYNAGPEAVDRYRGIPPYRETRVYVARVIHEFNRRVAARRSLAVVAQRGGMGAQ